MSDRAALQGRGDSAHVLIILQHLAETCRSAQSEHRVTVAGCEQFSCLTLS